MVEFTGFWPKLFDLLDGGDAGSEQMIGQRVDDIVIAIHGARVVV